MTRAPRHHRIEALIAIVLLALVATSTHAAIPASERAALLNLYATTKASKALSGNPADWVGPSGSECAWYGITCDAAGTTVTKIALSGLNLTGKLPGNLKSLANLTFFDVSNNQLTGPILALDNLNNLRRFLVRENAFTGPIPSLSGLTKLTDFEVDGNQLSGAIPDMTGLPSLTVFDASANQLTGPIPSLTDLQSLVTFHVANNYLSGPIPPIAELKTLTDFDVSNNLLTGLIPPLSGMTFLLNFQAGYNQLSGSIPSLAGLTSLTDFGVGNNRLAGTVPSLAGLAQLSSFDVSFNELTGPMPSLSGLTSLESLRVENNELTGAVPAVASPSALTAGNSSLCPNALNHTSDPSWDAATGQAPWYASCVALAANANLQGLWWNAAESGWGVNLAHQGDQIYATWYTYDVKGNAFWLSMLATRTTPTASDYRGDIYADVGPPFNDFTGSGTASRVGNGTLTFSDANTGSFAYNVSAGGVSYVQQAKPITRFVLDGTSAQPVCTYRSFPNLSAATNYQDLWWVPAESGWGVNFAHQGDQIFATWYTYDAKAPGAGNPPLWMSALMKRQGTSNVFTGTLSRTSGQRFDAYAPNFTAQTVGTATATFADGNNATFAYVTTGDGGVPASNQSKAITRFLFAAPAGTTCQ